MQTASVITIDGLAGAGKTSVSFALAQALGWHLLPSGLLYRLVAYHTAPGALEALSDMDLQTKVQMCIDGVVFAHENGQLQVLQHGTPMPTNALFAEPLAIQASCLAKDKRVRVALNSQMAEKFLKAPGLVAEGRDMGSVVFPKAGLKVSLSASLEVRAQRRTAQAQAAGNQVSFEKVLKSMQTRDAQDVVHMHSPECNAADASPSITLDTSALSVSATTERILEVWQGLG